MQVRCSECGTRYRVDDDLVRGRRVKLRCRRCAAIIPVVENRSSGVDQQPAVQSARRGPPPPPLPPSWFVVAGGDLAGPFYTNELRRRIEEGYLGPDALLWRAGMGQWLPLGAIEEFGGDSRALDPSGGWPPPPPPQVNAASDAVPGADAGAWPVGGVYAPLPAWPAAPAPPSGGKRPRRWPVWLACVGAAVVAAAAALVVQRDDKPAQRVAPARRSARRVAKPRRTGQPPISIHIGRAEIRIASSDEEGAGVTRLPAIEVYRDVDAGVADGGAGLLRQLDQRNVLAQRLFRRNQASLVACATLAERRGANLGGKAAVFDIRVGGSGEVEAYVSGDGLDARLLSCYEAVVRGWRFPAQGKPYRLSVRRLH